MALTVGTNSYVTVAEADAYFGDRLNADSWTSASVAIKEQALVTATRFVDERSWIGQAVSSSQKLGWPRNGATYLDPKLGVQISVPNDEVPERVKSAVFEQALHFINNGAVLGSSSNVYESITVGSISLTDANSKSKVSKTASSVISLVGPLVRFGSNGSGGGNTWWRAW
ncbi:head-tail adaptor Ad1 [Bacteriophage DSS3_VP1]|uniref:Putative DnaT-like domain-containing protein n=1 Tax=Bacteriophage DSS3_VP1 TaxID=2664196 RepID=A0A7S5KQ37_9CAUD|nr:head-tail adaptor Ad1 [Bacteriophage DSS3_VP1]QGH74599.1 hypothetical protein DSS3VP1_00031 [Bacteriophage DSS3_VP1]